MKNQWFQNALIDVLPQLFPRRFSRDFRYSALAVRKDIVSIQRCRSVAIADSTSIRVDYMTASTLVIRTMTVVGRHRAVIRGIYENIFRHEVGLDAIS